MHGEAKFLQWLFAQQHSYGEVGELARMIVGDIQNRCLTSWELNHLARIVQHFADSHYAYIGNVMGHALAVYQGSPQPRDRFRIRRRH